MIRSFLIGGLFSFLALVSSTVLAQSGSTGPGFGLPGGSGGGGDETVVGGKPVVPKPAPVNYPPTNPGVPATTPTPTTPIPGTPRPTTPAAKPILTPAKPSTTTRPTSPIKNTVENRDVRNNTLQNMVQKRASSTDTIKAEREGRKEEFKANRESIKTLKRADFDARKQGLIKELTTIVGNLKNIATRIDARISEDRTAARDTTSAVNLLNVAKTKIATAESKVRALASLTPTSTATGEVDAIKPRTAAQEAIVAVRDAREALKKVVEALSNRGGTPKLHSAGSTTPPGQNPVTNTNQ